MKRTVFCGLLIALLVPFKVFSQVDIEWLPPVKGGKFTWTDISYIDKSDDELQVFFIATGMLDPGTLSKVYLATLSQSSGTIVDKQEVINSKVLSGGDEFRSYTSLAFYKVGSNLVWIYASKTKIYARTISGTDVSEKTELMEVPEKFDFRLSISPNKSLFSVLAYPSKKNADENLRLATFDQNLNQVYSEQFQLETEAEKVSVHSLGLSDNGDYFMILSNKKPKGEKVKGGPTDNFYLYTVFNNNNEYISASAGIKLDFGSNSVTGIIAREDTTDGSLIIAGTYSEKPYGSIKGLFLTKANSNWSEVGDIVFNEMDTKISRGLSINVFDKDDVGLLTCKELFFTQDGGYAMHVEVEFVIYKPVDMGIITIYLPEYNSGPGGILKFTAEGEAQWGYTIPKRQAAMNIPPPTYTGSQVYYYNGKFYMFHNNHPKNLAKSDGTAATVYSIGLGGFVSTVINDNGDADTRMEMLYKEIGIAPYLRSFVRTSDNEIFFIGYGKKGTGMGKIKLQ